MQRKKIVWENVQNNTHIIARYWLNRGPVHLVVDDDNKKLKIHSFSGLNTYVYAFTNLETRKAYAAMFARIFQVLGDVARHLVKFPRGEEGVRVANR
jgi:hypothetical protein